MKLVSTLSFIWILTASLAGLSVVNIHHPKPANVTLLPLSELSLWEDNYRQGDVDAIAASIVRFGFNGALRIWQRTVVAGNHALKALNRLQEQGQVPHGIVVEDGAWLVPTIDVGHLSKTEAHAFAIADNRTQELGENDDEKLAKLLEQISIEDASLPGAAGVDDQSLAELLQILHEPKVADPDDDQEITKADELQEKWLVQPGDVWLIGNHVLACGSSTDPEFVKAAAPGPARVIWTDPPYGVSYTAKNDAVAGYKGGSQRRGRHKPIEGDDSPNAPLLFRECLSAAFCSPGCSVYASAPAGDLFPRFIDAMTDAGFPFRHELVWVKNASVFGRADYHGKHEPILYGWKNDGAHYFDSDRSGKVTVFEVDKPRVSEEHPTMKPVELIRQMIVNSSKVGDVIYDGFSGSGSTLLACEDEGRIGFGIEIEPAFVAVTLERFAKRGMTPIKST